MTHTIVVLSDIQAPYEDSKLVKEVIKFVGVYQPNEVVQIGDLIDLPQPSRWSKGTRAEFEGSVFRDAEYTKRTILKPLRDAFGGKVGVIEGNHDLRGREYLAKYAPALAESQEFNFENLLDFDGFGITKLPDFYEFAPGWVMTHGHLGKISLSRIAGNTALNAARKMGTSVIMGHTHRLGKCHETIGFNGVVQRQLTGVEVGHMMDMKKAGYLKSGTANWQQGFAIVRVGGKNVQVDTIEIRNRRFIVDGVTYPV